MCSLLSFVELSIQNAYDIHVFVVVFFFDIRTGSWSNTNLTWWQVAVDENTTLGACSL